MVISKYFFLTIWLMVMSIGSVLSKDLTLYTSSSIPPYVIAESDNGIAVDIVRAAFALKGYKVQFLVAPNRRVEKQLTEGKADGAFNLPQKRIVNVFYSQPVLYYDDLAVSLASSHLQIDKLEDLAGKRIIGFQNAPKFIGEKFAEIVLNNLAYSEVGDQELQVRMLYAGDRTDVIVLDRNIFYIISTSKKIHRIRPDRMCSIQFFRGYRFMLHLLMPLSETILIRDWKRLNRAANIKKLLMPIWLEIKSDIFKNYAALAIA